MKREILNHIQALVASSEDRFTKARELARIIRGHGQYRWVGVYDVGLEEVAILSWSGPGAPAHPTFSINRGLTASVIREKRPVIVGDVRNDCRYLTAFGSTLSEAIIPVLDHSTAVIGTIDVESERANAFSDVDRYFLEQCAKAALPLWLTSADI
jgi:putative methionine-R-sulfoxide reductase with GAF domain